MRLYNFKVTFKTHRHAETKERTVTALSMPAARLHAIVNFDAHEIVKVQKTNKTKKTN